MAGPAGHLGGNDGRAGPAERLVDRLARARSCSRSAGFMHSTGFCVPCSMPVVLAGIDVPERRLLAVAGPVRAAVPAHRVPARLVLPVIVAAAERKAVLGPDDLRAHLEAGGLKRLLHRRWHSGRRARRRRLNVRNGYGRPIDKGALYKLLGNQVYIGEAVHKGTAYPGEHEAIIDRKLWDRVHAILRESPRARGATSRAKTPALLKGLIFDAGGTAMSPTHTRRNGRLYRYYTSQKVIKGEVATTDMRVPAGEIEEIVIGQLRRMIATPEVIVATWKQLRRKSSQWTESAVRDSLVSFDAVWVELFPTEQSRILNLLIGKGRCRPRQGRRPPARRRLFVAGL